MKFLIAALAIHALPTTEEPKKPVFIALNANANEPIPVPEGIQDIFSDALKNSSQVSMTAIPATYSNPVKSKDLPLSLKETKPQETISTQNTTTPPMPTSKATTIPIHWTLFALTLSTMK
ncbi:hypothetical protein DSO57_1019449 [Entomophthora muscae]|uniref:Uncharacterized protein n=1 Tax=Entomophthora muscae TaxID=34485 RepID=A0ACC2RV15_9FUNG|nr:hypothetical protein DSO57_1019449 [Entomophthora muscae]